MSIAKDRRTLKKEVLSWGWETSGDTGIAQDLKGAEVLYACYVQESYEGDAHVVYIKDGVVYEVEAHHCSCNGPEWHPKATTALELIEAWPRNEALAAALAGIL